MDKKLKIGITCYPSLGGSGVVATEPGQITCRTGASGSFYCQQYPVQTGYVPEKYFLSRS